MLMRPLNITEVMNGYIVQAGCQTLVFRNITDLCAELKRYAEDPYRVEQEYLAKYRAEKGRDDVQAPGGLPGTGTGTTTPPADYYAKMEQIHRESRRFMEGPNVQTTPDAPTVRTR